MPDRLHHLGRDAALEPRMTTPWWAWLLLSAVASLQGDNAGKVWLAVLFKLCSIATGVIAFILILMRGV